MKSWILLIDFKILSFQVLDMILMRYALKNWVDLGIKKEKKQQQEECTSLLPFRALYAWLTLHFFCCSCKEILFEVCRHILLGHVYLNGEHELNPNDCAPLMIQ